MLKTIITGFVLLLNLFACSQDLPAIAKTGKHPEYFVPKGWDILAQAKGDINKDGIEDYAVVIKDLDEDMNEEKDYQRIFIVLLRNKDRSCYLYHASEKAILCKRCGGVFGDPFQSLVIKNGELSIEHFGGSAERWGISNVFIWNGKDLVLVKSIKSSASATDADNTYKEETKTPKDFGKILLKDFDVQK